MDYKEKYLKYKTKYLSIKNQFGGMDPVGADVGRYGPGAESADAGAGRAGAGAGARGYNQLLPDVPFIHTLQFLDIDNLLSLHMGNSVIPKNLILSAIKQKIIQNELTESDYSKILRYNNEELTTNLMHRLANITRSDNFKTLFDVIYKNQYVIDPNLYIPALKQFVNVYTKEYLLTLGLEANKENIRDITPQVMDGKLYGMLRLLMFKTPEYYGDIYRHRGDSYTIHLYFVDNDNRPVRNYIAVNNILTHPQNTCSVFYIDNGTSETIDVLYNIDSIFEVFKTKIAENMTNNLKPYKCVFYNVSHSYSNSGEDDIPVHPLQIITPEESSFVDSQYKKFFEITL